METFLIQNGDIVIGASGQPTMVNASAKLRQDVQENLSIETQRDGFGAGLDGLIGVLGDEFSLRAEVARRVRASIGVMIELQNRFHRAQRVTMERISRVKQILVTPVAGKKTTFLFKVDVVSIAGDSVAVTTVGT